MPTDLFHITAIPNLASVVATGALLPKNMLVETGQQHADIAYQTIQGRRALKPVSCGPGGVLHDYVPFYFAPRSPMLFTINNGNVPNCPFRQDDIVHLHTTIEATTAFGMNFVFFNYNAATSFAQPFDDLANLNAIDWPLFFEAPRIGQYCKYWHSIQSNPRYARRMETRQAEFLTHGPLPLGAVAEVVTRTNAIAAQVRQILSAGSALTVRVDPTYYY